jgi:ketosteroid isomerase-like protein
MVEESLLSANSPEAMLSKCEFKDSKLRTWKQRIPYFWPKEARGKWSLQIVAH